MSTVTVKAKTSFVHGSYTMAHGDMVEMPAPVAEELERAGLIDTVLKKVAKAPPPAPPVPPEPPTKVVTPDEVKETNPGPADKPEAQKQEAAHANKMEKPAANKSK